jgi:hypothetical protein
MPTQTQIATQPIAGPYPALPVGAGSLDLVFTAADPVNGNYFVADQFSYNSSAPGIVPAGSIGGDYILVWNTDTNPHNFGLASVPVNGRSGDVGGGLTPSYVVGAGVVSAFKLSQLAGWQDAFSNVLFKADSALVKFAILQR